MKHLKKFEEIDPIIYNIFKFIKPEYDEDLTAEDGDLYITIPAMGARYNLTIYNIRNQKVQDLLSKDIDKLKMATHSEIEEFKLKYDMKKYNL